MNEILESEINTETILTLTIVGWKQLVRADFEKQKNRKYFQ